MFHYRVSLVWQDNFSLPPQIVSKYRRHQYHHYNIPSVDQLEWFQDVNLSSSSISTTNWSVNISPLTQIPSIAKYAKYIPRVQEIYLSGDITWKQSSQTIGLCIIATPQRMWTVYIAMKLILWCIRIINPHHYHIQAIIDRDNMSIYPLAYKPIDPYLVYWIAHLTLVYMDYNTESTDIYFHNHRILHILPMYQCKQVNNNNMPVILWSHHVKIILQKIGGKRIWDTIEKILHLIIHTYFIWRYCKHIDKMPLVTNHIIALRPPQRFDDYLLYKHHR